ncbi:carbohydrate binding family 9 domain-containing protein [Pyxidicoccus parkwayensis]|uniref:Carbohydrate binding family 9 domain-containing protein n=1 Tax=Pyxidicoccus parkwayensis TaxID=2813578 RepID=A0ABX7P4H3_9BACT|nr:DUF5916 domain-containing protein [Pyxidicoccus parkwaysis]QSQ25387.1 carbohydrate binding family 9 domain-containing protein [Pyxidicoccus parkwaysis]
MSSHAKWVAALLVALCGTVSQGALEGPGKDQFLRAARTPGRITVDGRLDEPVWATAPVFDGFVQRFPKAGATPTERTELRVLYDDDTLYVGVYAHDSQPALIDYRLGRRDSLPRGDSVHLLIDSAHDHRTAMVFSLSASGVQSDGLYFDDRNYTQNWDGVWDAAAASAPDGWVAEYAIPLSLLPFPQAEVQTWGFSVRRDIGRKNEEIESVENPRTTNAVASRLGHLTGMEALRPHARWEVRPYLAARGVMRPQFSAPAQPTPRLLSPVLDVGLDAKAAVTSDLTLSATLNPDFGEVEADQLLLNLSTFESFYPERRPFFTQGLELFEPVGMTSDTAPMSLFYSRRIGLATPILGAAKMTGTVGSGVQVGVMEALVTAPWQQRDETSPDRALHLNASRPLHLGPGVELPGAPTATTNFLVAMARTKVGTSSRVGVSLASAQPFEGTCRPEDVDPQLGGLPPASCTALGSLAGALDFDLKTGDSQWGVLGLVTASRAVAGPPERLLRDGTVLRRGDAGLGGYVRAGRFGGKGFRPELGLDFAQPTLELNATGFQRTQNAMLPRFQLQYAQPDGFGPLNDFFATFTVKPQWTADGRRVYRGTSASLSVDSLLPSFDVLGVQGTLDVGGYDVRELSGTGVPLERTGVAYFGLYGTTKSTRLVSVGGNAGINRRLVTDAAPAHWDWAASLYAVMTPHPALQTRVEVGSDRTRHGPRYVMSLDDSDSQFLLGDLDSRFLSLTLRQQWIVSPKLTLQGYAQLFTAYGVYGRYFTAQSDAARSRIDLDALEPSGAPANFNFHDTALNVNAVARWEYRLGSTLFLVYSHTQQGLPTPVGEVAPATLGPKRLLDGPATDAVMLKWSYYWGA